MAWCLNAVCCKSAAHTFHLQSQLQNFIHVTNPIRTSEEFHFSRFAYVWGAYSVEYKYEAAICFYCRHLLGERTFFLNKISMAAKQFIVGSKLRHSHGLTSNSINIFICGKETSIKRKVSSPVNFEKKWFHWCQLQFIRFPLVRCLIRND